MYPRVVTKDPTAVQVEVQSAYLAMFPKGDATFVPRVFGWAIQCFTGRYEDYLPVDARYHDFEHTLQGTLCLAHLLEGRARAKATPELTPHMFELALLAILFHDTGYLKKKNDREGTGAKYTPIHVMRSVGFAGEFLCQQGYNPSDILAVQNMIRCTGVNADLHSIPFQSPLEQTLGFALATSDLLGQMAAEDYVEKLPVLYQEFAEAARYKPENSANAARLAAFASAEDLMRKTPGFWEGYVLPRINGDFGQLYRYLSDPYPDGPNHYLQKIEERIAQLRQRFGLNAAKK
jgi:hypothetical protein